ncbi:MFS transporter [Pseudonocardia alni]|uniref:MFS transporter n=1 Tax=Pseudonocardia alni TaxID=33907 RepID=UPI0033E0D7F9
MESRWGSYERHVLTLVTASVLAAVVSSTVLSVSLPVFSRALDTGPLGSTWLLLAPLLAGTCLLVPLGRIADLVGRRELYLLGLTVFTAGGLGAGFATGTGPLLGLLVIQSLGAAMVLCNTGAVVGSVFRGPGLARAMGIYLAGVSVGQMLGPVVGALVADALGWRAVFWVQVPLGLACLVLGAAVLGRLPERDRPSVSSPDLPGGALLALAVAALLLTVSTVAAGHPPVWVLPTGVAVVVLAGAGFVVVERRAARPLVSSRLLRDRVFVRANVGNMLSVPPRFVAATVVGLHFQAALGDPAVVAGLKLLPLPVGITAGSLLCGRIAARVGARAAGRTASAAMVLGLTILAAALGGGHYPVQALGLLVLGAGGGLFGAVVSTVIVRAAPVEEIGTVNGLRITLMNVTASTGLALGLALAVSLVPVVDRAAVLQARAPGPLGAALTGGLLLVLAVMAVVAVVAGLVLPRVPERD